MDPITMVATLITTKAIEKVGEKMGEGGLSLGGRLMQKLRHKAPKAVAQLEASADPTVIDAEILEEIRQVADAEPTVKAGVDAVAAAAVLEGNAFPSLTKLAETINGANFGSGPQTNNFNV